MLRSPFSWFRAARLPLKWLCAVLLYLTSVGCGGGTPSVDMGGEDGKSVAMLVEEMNDAKGTAKKQDPLFVKPVGGKTKEFAKYDYYVVGQPSVSGTTATCKVSIQRTDGSPAGEMEWTFEKVGDAWKIKTAPLP